MGDYKSDWWIIVFACLLPSVGGFAAQLFSGRPGEWYESLTFPSFRPPNWLFSPVWFTIFTLIGFSSYLVWRDGNGFKGAAKIPLIIYVVQLLLNWTWTVIFFGFHAIKLSFIEIIILDIFVILCVVGFYKINKLAALLFIPYLAWLSFATVLDYNMYVLNPDNGNNTKSN